MNVSAWCIRNPIPAVMFFVLLCIAGVVSYLPMKVQSFPDLDVPTIVISAGLQGAAPSQMETEVVQKIENALVGLDGLNRISSTIQGGNASVVAEFRLEKSSQEALDEVGAAVQQIRSNLPAEMPKPFVQKINVSGAPILAYAVRYKETLNNTADLQALSWLVDDTIHKKLMAVKGVAGVTRVGGVQRQVQIELNTTTMQGLGVTTADVSRLLGQLQINASGGTTHIGSGEQSVHTLSSVHSAQELGNLVVTLAPQSNSSASAAQPAQVSQSQKTVHLNEIAQVIDTAAAPTSSAFLNGVSVVGFEITRSKGASDVEAGQGVRQALKELQVSHPELLFTEAFDFVTTTEEEYKASVNLLLEGGALAVVVVWLFL